MFEAIVYFAGPATLWARRPQEVEYVARFSSRWSWLAASRASACCSSLNLQRCGWFLLKDGRVVEHVKATVFATGGAPR